MAFFVITLKTSKRNRDAKSLQLINLGSEEGVLDQTSIKSDGNSKFVENL